ncbi:MAG TPA: DUF4163 domain-containing protein [Sphingomicrobium sp.]|nr:DUF4163 domain-containing protein [Sphingomicrobium sp.]
MLHLARLALCALTIAAAAPPDPPAAKDYTTLEAGALVDFRYSFPTGVGSHPELLEIILSDRAKRHAEALETAREDAEMRRPQNTPFHPHYFLRDWVLAGQTEQLMSLRSQTQTFTGGAHGMHTTGLILWDKEKKAALPFSDLFAPSGFWPILSGRVCQALASERLERAGMESTSCPKPDELVFVPSDTTSDWRFDTIQVVADPYVAGSYAEGRYEVRIPVTGALLAAVKPEYRSSFEAQRAQ